MAQLFLFWFLVMASCQRLESPDRDCEEGFLCKPHSNCSSYAETRAQLKFLKNSENLTEHDTLLETLKGSFCNKANRGVCCQENFELVNGNIVESIEEMPFIARLRIKTGFGSWSICGAALIANQFLLSAKHCFDTFYDQCIDEHDCGAYFRDIKISGWDQHDKGQFYVPIVEIFERKGVSDLVVVKLKHPVEEHEDYSLGVPLTPIRLADEDPRVGEVKQIVIIICQNGKGFIFAANLSCST